MGAVGKRVALGGVVDGVVTIKSVSASGTPARPSARSATAAPVASTAGSNMVCLLVPKRQLADGGPCGEGGGV